MDRYYEPVHRKITGIVKDKSIAEDIVQDVFLKVWTRADQWGGQGSFSHWLFRMATNMALNSLRTVKRRRSQSLDTVPEAVLNHEVYVCDSQGIGADALLERMELLEQVQTMVDTLPEQQRQVIRLVHNDEMEIREVADLLNIPSGTVKSRLYYAREELVRQWNAFF